MYLIDSGRGRSARSPSTRWPSARSRPAACWSRCPRVQGSPDGMRTVDAAGDLGSPSMRRRRPALLDPTANCSETLRCPRSRALLRVRRAGAVRASMLRTATERSTDEQRGPAAGRRAGLPLRHAGSTGRRCAAVPALDPVVDRAPAADGSTAAPEGARRSSRPGRGATLACSNRYRGGRRGAAWRPAQDHARRVRDADPVVQHHPRPARRPRRRRCTRARCSRSAPTTWRRCSRWT